MGLCRVYNKNTYPYNEKFKGKEVCIPAGEFITMDELEAVQFMGTMGKPVFNENKEVIPENRKMLVRERLTDAQAKEPATPKFVCQQDGKEFKTQEELDSWIATAHSDKWVDEEKARESMKAERDKRRST